MFLQSTVLITLESCCFHFLGAGVGRHDKSTFIACFLILTNN